MQTQKRAPRAMRFRLIKLINDKRRWDEQTGSDKCVCTPAAIQSAIVGDITMSSEPKRFSRRIISVSHRHCRRHARRRRCHHCTIVDDVGKYRLTLDVKALKTHFGTAPTFGKRIFHRDVTRVVNFRVYFRLDRERGKLLIPSLTSH